MTQQISGPAPALTVDQACTALGIGKSKIYELLRRGEIKAFDINGVEKRRVGQPGRRRSLRIEQAEIDRFKKERQIAA